MPAKLTKRAVEAMAPKEKPYDVRDTEVRGFLVTNEPAGQAPAAAVSTGPCLND